MNQYNNINLKEKLILIFLYNLMTIIVLYSFFSPSKFYEISIYSNFPNIILLFLIAIPLIITIIYCSLITSNKIPPESIIFFLILLLFMSRLIIQWLPFIRGYFTFQGDHMSQIGICKDIIQYGSINQDDFYPITHIFLTIINLFTDVSIVDIGNYSTGIISLLFLVWLYILSKII